MFDFDVIQYRGFRNTYDKDGNCDGFQFCVRSTYYRGVYLSQLRIGRVIVDGEEFLAESGNVIWEIDGVDYLPVDMAKDGVTFWSMMKPATIKVKKPGGLKQGYHDVAIRFAHYASYMPPSMEVFDDTKEVMTHTGSNTFKRRMLIV